MFKKPTYNTLNLTLFKNIVSSITSFLKNIWSYEPARLAIILFLITGTVTFLLAVTNSTTVDLINANNFAREEESMKLAFSTADSFIPYETDSIKLPEEVVNVYSAMFEGNLQGYVFKLSTIGYGGTMSVIVGVDTNATIKGVSIASMSETPGLGAKASDEPFISQFIGKISPLSVVKGVTSKSTEIEAISGATVTSKAVTVAAQSALDAYQIIAGGSAE